MVYANCSYDQLKSTSGQLTEFKGSSQMALGFLLLSQKKDCYLVVGTYQFLQPIFYIYPSIYMVGLVKTKTPSHLIPSPTVNYSL